MRPFLNPNPTDHIDVDRHNVLKYMLWHASYARSDVIHAEWMLADHNVRADFQVARAYRNVSRGLTGLDDIPAGRGRSYVQTKLQDVLAQLERVSRLYD